MVAPRLDEDESAPHALDGNPHFTALGYDHDSIYFYVHEKKMIQPITESYGAIKGNLLKLANLDFWEREFPGDQGTNENMAINSLIRLAHRRGVYDPSTIRGRGAWIDDGRVVFHCGDKLLVDGVETDCAAIDSEWVYERARHLASPASTPLTDDEGRNLANIARRFRWERSSSALLLLGWCALAPVCGALEWRPHIWMTGGAGCGKTTIQEHFIRVMTSGTALFANGHSTEAGLRQELRADARALQFDETEQNGEKDKFRVQNSIAMVRQASSQSGAMTFKGTTSGQSMSFQPRTMAVFSSIGVELTSDADRDRISILSLKSRNESPGAAAEWAVLSADLAEINRDPELSRRILRRALDLLPMTQKNIKLFTRVAAERFGSQREGDQYGTLLAGAWSLMSSREAPREEIERLIDKYDWSDFVEHTQTDDSERALAVLLQAPIRMPRGETITVYELIRSAADRGVDGVDIKSRDALRFLGQHGMAYRVDGECGPELLVSNSSRGLKTLIDSTDYGTDLRGHLLRHKGARKFPNTFRFMGSKDRCVAVRVGDLLYQDDGEVHEYVPGADVGAELGAYC